MRHVKLTQKSKGGCFFWAGVILLLLASWSGPAEARLLLGTVSPESGGPESKRVKLLEDRLAAVLNESIEIKLFTDTTTLVRWMDSFAMVDLALLPGPEVGQFAGKFLGLGPVDADSRWWLVARQGITGGLPEKIAPVLESLASSRGAILEPPPAVVPLPAEAKPDRSPVQRTEVTGPRSSPQKRPDGDDGPSRTARQEPVPTRPTLAPAGKALKLGLLPKAANLLQTDQQAEALAGALTEMTGIEIRTQIFSEADTFIAWLQRYRILDLVLVPPKLAEQARLGSYRPIVEITGPTGAKPTVSRDILFLRADLAEGLVKDLQRAMLNLEKSAAGKTFLAQVGVASILADGNRLEEEVSNRPVAKMEAFPEGPDTIETILSPIPPPKPELIPRLPRIRPGFKPPVVPAPAPTASLAKPVPDFPASPLDLPKSPPPAPGLPEPPVVTDVPSVSSFMTKQGPLDLPRTETPIDPPSGPPAAPEISAISVPSGPPRQLLPVAQSQPPVDVPPAVIGPTPVPTPTPVSRDEPDFPEVVAGRLPAAPEMPAAPTLSSPTSAEQLPVEPETPIDLPSGPPSAPEISAISVPPESPRQSLPVAQSQPPVDATPAVTGPAPVPAPTPVSRDEPDFPRVVAGRLPATPEMPAPPTLFSPPPAAQLPARPETPLVQEEGILLRPPEKPVAPSLPTSEPGLYPVDPPGGPDKPVPPQEPAGAPPLPARELAAAPATPKGHELREEVPLAKQSGETVQRPAAAAKQPQGVPAEAEILAEDVVDAPPAVPNTSDPVVGAAPEDVALGLLLPQDREVPAVIAQPDLPQALRPPGVPVPRPRSTVREQDDQLLIASLPEPRKMIKRPGPKDLLPRPVADPGVIYIIPFQSVMVPREVESRLFDRFIETLSAEEAQVDRDFVILKEGLQGVDPEWLASRNYVTGEIYAYVEESGCCSTDLRTKARLVYHRPNQQTPAFAFNYPAQNFFDHDRSTLETERRRLADEVSQVLAGELLKALSP